jgi:hypothetical protein
MPLPGKAPVEDFLFRQRRGHCEVFATAMAVSLREVGIPSRLVTGFLGAEAGLFGNTWVVRGKNAHAWVEAWCGPERGWVTFDPTPAEGRPAIEKASWLRSLRNAGEDVEFFYDRWVLSFGESDQGDLVRWVRDAAGTAGSALLAAIRPLAKGKRFAAGALACVALLLVVVRWAIGLRKRPGRSGFRFLSHGLPPGAAAYQNARHLLAKAGLPITPATAPSETLAVAARLGPHVSSILRDVISRYIAESYGGQTVTRDDERSLVGLLKRLRSALADSRERKSR